MRCSVLVNEGAVLPIWRPRSEGRGTERDFNGIEQGQGFEGTGRAGARGGREGRECKRGGHRRFVEEEISQQGIPVTSGAGSPPALFRIGAIIADIEHLFNIYFWPFGSWTFVAEGDRTRKVEIATRNGQTKPSLDSPFSYTGREWDADAGLYYYRARWYDPAGGGSREDWRSWVPDAEEAEEGLRHWEEFKFFANSPDPGQF